MDHQGSMPMNYWMVWEVHSSYSHRFRTINKPQDNKHNKLLNNKLRLRSMLNKQTRSKKQTMNTLTLMSLS